MDATATRKAIKNMSIMPIIPILIAGALGFALGCKYKDCLCKKESSKDNSRINIKPIVIKQPSASASTSGFSLKRIEEVFSRFKTPLNSANSFAMLLDAIEEQSYIDILKQIKAIVKTPSSLYDFLNEESYNPISYKIKEAQGQPEISNAQLDVILSQNNVDAHILESSAQKVEFLLTLYQGKGVKRFQESFGNELSQFMNRYSSNEEVLPLFESIMATVERRLHFLS